MHKNLWFKRGFVFSALSMMVFVSGCATADAPKRTEADADTQVAERSVPQTAPQTAPEDPQREFKQEPAGA